MQAATVLLVSLAIALPACVAREPFDLADDLGASSTTDDAIDGSDSSGADAAPPDLAECVHACSTDDDCSIHGFAGVFVCRDHACVDALPCATHEDCVARFSYWIHTPCTKGGGECGSTGQICVDLGDGRGGCAPPPDADGDCEIGYRTWPRQALDDGSIVVVCGSEAARCDVETAHCFFGCNLTCGSRGECDRESGECICQSDENCDGGTCVAGECIPPPCTSAADCETDFDGGTLACV